jgi:hypothetical protein
MKGSGGRLEAPTAPRNGVWAEAQFWRDLQATHRTIAGGDAFRLSIIDYYASRTVDEAIRGHQVGGDERFAMVHLVRTRMVKLARDAGYRV